MPIYEYRCENGHNFEVRQSFSDEPVETCEECGAAVQRVFRPVAVHFKGSGFYNTDYGTRKRAREKESASSEKSSEKKSDSGSSDSGSSSSSDSSSGESKSSGEKKPAGGEAAKPAAA